MQNLHPFVYNSSVLGIYTKAKFTPGKTDNKDVVHG